MAKCKTAPGKKKKKRRRKSCFQPSPWFLQRASVVWCPVPGCQERIRAVFLQRVFGAAAEDHHVPSSALATLLSIDNLGSNPCFFWVLRQNPTLWHQKWGAVTAAMGWQDPWEQPLLTQQTWLCSASATSWGQSDGTTVTLPSVMHSFKDNMDLSHNPAQATCSWRARTHLHPAQSWNSAGKCGENRM